MLHDLCLLFEETYLKFNLIFENTFTQIVNDPIPQYPIPNT